MIINLTKFLFLTCSDTFFLFSTIVSIGFCKFLNLWFYSCSVEWVAVYLCREENNSVLSRPDCARHSAPPRFPVQKYLKFWAQKYMIFWAQKYLRFWAQIFLRFWNSQVIISCCLDSARHWALPRFHFTFTKIFRISLKMKYHKFIQGKYWHL